jgi:hypothetical protein
MQEIKSILNVLYHNQSNGSKCGLPTDDPVLFQIMNLKMNIIIGAVILYLSTTHPPQPRTNTKTTKERS